MSITAIDAVLAAVVTALKEAPVITGCKVYEEGEIDEIPENDQLALVVGLEAAQPGPIVLSGAPLRWNTVIRLECFARRNVRRSDGKLPTTDLHAQAHARVIADQTLGGLVGGIQLVRVAVDRDLAATRTGALLAFYAIDHRSTEDLLPA